MEISKYFSEAYGSIVLHGPKVLAALIILVIAVIAAKILQRAVKYLAGRSWLNKYLGSETSSVSDSLGAAVFWIVILIALPAILGALGLQGILNPMRSMADKFLAFVPNLFAGALIFVVGYIVATIARKAIESVLKAADTDQFAERAGLSGVTGETGIANFAGLLVFTLLIIPVAIAALDALKLSAISVPAIEMLTRFLDAIPNIFAASIVILLSYMIGRFARSTISGLLPATGIDKIAASADTEAVLPKGTKPSTIAGQIAFFAIMIFGAIAATKLLNFPVISDLLAQLLTLGGRILLGSAIIAFGVYVANIVASLMTGKAKKAPPVSTLVKIAIIILSVAMGLRQMGVANEIVSMGFNLLIGALALGMAIAIGWGGKDTAARLLEKWTKNL